MVAVLDVVVLVDVVLAVGIVAFVNIVVVVVVMAVVFVVVNVGVAFGLPLFMSAVFDPSIIINYRKFYSSLGKRKTKIKRDWHI